MKKILYILALTVGITFSSCDMDQMPSTSIPNNTAFDDMPSILALERGAYARLQAIYNLSNILVPDIMADYMHAVYGFTGTYGQPYYWTYTSEESDVETGWNTLYAAIAQFNFILDGLKNPMELPFQPTASDLDEIEYIVAECKFMRAMCYNMLVERFCADYEPSTADTPHSGVPLVLKYDVKEKPERETLANVYAAILADIADAKPVLKTTQGQPNAIALTGDCVSALEARVLLQMHRYKDAYDAAKALIDTKTYPLATSAADLKRMWEYDKSSEIIFVFYASTTELPLTYGIDFYRDNNGGMQMMHLMLPNYIPSQKCLDSYEEADWRRTAYFFECASNASNPEWMYVPGFDAFARHAYLLSKYPGNPDLRTSSGWNYYNSFKPFRIAEMYLIAAEAALAGSTGDAKILNELREHRGLAALDDVTMADVQQERYREMIMEGTRMTDLKRWKLNVARGAAQEGYLSDASGNLVDGEKHSYVTAVAKDLEIKYDNYMAVWPIPASEIFANKNLADQQNPGWER